MRKPRQGSQEWHPGVLIPRHVHEPLAQLFLFVSSAFSLPTFPPSPCLHHSLPLCPLPSYSLISTSPGMVQSPPVPVLFHPLDPVSLPIPAPPLPHVTPPDPAHTCSVSHCLPVLLLLRAGRGGGWVPREGGQGEDAQEQLDGVEEQQDGIEDGLQPQGVGLQQQVISCHHGRWECQGQADGERHLPLAQVPLGACHVAQLVRQLIPTLQPVTHAASWRGTTVGTDCWGIGISPLGHRLQSSPRAGNGTWSLSSLGLWLQSGPGPGTWMAQAKSSSAQGTDPSPS